MNSKRKGSAGERELAKKLRDLGFKEARRSQQYAGINNDADLVGVPGVHIECKRVAQPGSGDGTGDKRRKGRRGTDGVSQEERKAVAGHNDIG